MVTDPISHMLTAIKNGSMAGKKAVSIPFSSIKFEIANVLAREGFIASVVRDGKDTSKTLTLELRYEDGIPRVTDVERVSKPSRRMYMGSKDIRPVRQGFGLLVLSTPKGILSGFEAKKEHVGGEILFRIW